MFSKAKFGIVFDTLFAVLLSGALTLFIKIVNHQLTLETFLIGFISSFAINFTLETYVPLKKMGDGIARKFGLKNENSFIFHLVRVFFIVLLMAAVMSFLCMFIEMGFAPVFLGVWIKAFPMILLVAYVVAVVFFPVIAKVTAALCSREPKK